MMNHSEEADKLRTALAVLRITLGIIILATWWENLQKGLYTAEGLTGFFNWLFDAQNGNGSSLIIYKSILDATVLRVPDLFATFQMVVELLLGLALLLGVLTPLAGAGASFFFFNLLLSYLGGHEWIWVYVLLTMAALVVAVTRSGRSFLGCDQLLVSQLGEPRYPFLW
jgi:uncharacterized membrane protein YphA (DoxX/SURF4 family)